MTTRLRLLIRFRPVLRFINHRILHTEDSPQRIGRGIAIGLFTACLPLFGVHLILAFFFAWALRANKAMAMLFVWVSNPLTAPFIYYPCYRVGRFILGFFQSEPVASPEQIKAIFIEILSFERVLTNLFNPDLWQQIRDVFLTIGQEMFVGGVLIGLIAAKISYSFSVTFIRFHRTRRTRRKSGLSSASN